MKVRITRRARQRWIDYEGEGELRPGWVRGRLASAFLKGVRVVAGAVYIRLGRDGRGRALFGVFIPAAGGWVLVTVRRRRGCLAARARRPGAR